MNVFHPITRELGLAIETAIFNQLKKVMSQGNAGYRGFDTE